MRNPEFNHFDLDEYRRRRTAAAARMQAAGLDALLVTTESNVRYLAGLLNQYWVASMHDDMQIALIPADDRIEPALFLADHLAGGTARTSWIDDVRIWSQFGTGKSSSPIQILADTLTEKGLARSRIGMEIGGGSVLNMPLPRYAAPTSFESLPSGRWTPHTSVFSTRIAWRTWKPSNTWRLGFVSGI